ncbi:hypothetical protein L1987_60320 [Smallanthus sonchifolius]|uniref:Uncharacterized protein n=1 Tax=Smallanthus sonchifolius TaxID=185202 RepID=A0ACB9D8J4_9ASTR|nr:hypothetical protein L1987_60320 [Smallanthus sonchifolius]
MIYDSFFFPNPNRFHRQVIAKANTDLASVHILVRRERARIHCLCTRTSPIAIRRLDTTPVRPTFCQISSDQIIYEITGLT